MVSAMKKLALTLSLTSLAAFPLHGSTLLAGWAFNNPANGDTLDIYRPSNGGQKTTAGLIVDGTVGSSNLIEPSDEPTYDTGERTISGTGSGLGGAFLFTDTIDQITAFDTSGLNNKELQLYTNADFNELPSNTLNGKSLVFSFNTTGWADILLQGVAERGSLGPSNNTWAWSTDGTSYTTFQSGWNPSTTFGLFTLDLTALSQLDNKANVYLKLTLAGQGVATGDANYLKLDNIQIGANTAYTASAISTWRNTYFPGSGSEIDLLDADKDGLSNLLEYALNSSPLAASKAPVQTITGGRLALTLAKNAAATDVTVIVQGADSVSGPWTDLAQSVNGAAYAVLAVGTVVNETSPSVEVQDQFAIDGAHPNRFLRVSVVAP
jgi:hypothetical protein